MVRRLQCFRSWRSRISSVTWFSFVAPHVVQSIPATRAVETPARLAVRPRRRWHWLTAVALLGLGLVALQAEIQPCGWPDSVVKWSRCRLALHIPGRVRSLGFSPDGRTIAVGVSDGTIELRRSADGVHRRTLAGAQSWGANLAFSPDGALLAAGAWDGTVGVWRVADGMLLHTFADLADGQTHVAFSPDGTTVAAGSSGGSDVRLWHVVDGTLLRTIKGNAHTVVFDVAASPDGAQVAVADDQSIQFWRVADGSLVRTLPGFQSKIAFSPDGTHLAAEVEDSRVQIWRVGDGVLLRTLPKHTVTVTSLVWAPDGATLATGGIGDRTVRLWRVADGRLQRNIRGHLDLSHNFQADVEAAAFSPDGTLLAFAASTSEGEFTNTTLRLWRLW